MVRSIFIVALAGVLAGCVVAPGPPGYYSYDYGYGPGYYAPGYYYAEPSIGIGIGFDGGHHGWHGGHGGWHGR